MHPVRLDNKQQQQTMISSHVSDAVYSTGSNRSRLKYILFLAITSPLSNERPNTSTSILLHIYMTMFFVASSSQSHSFPLKWPSYVLSSSVSHTFICLAAKLPSGSHPYSILVINPFNRYCCIISNKQVFATYMFISVTSW